MNRLFVKIFLWFWLTTIVIVIATAVVTTQFNRSFSIDPLREHFERTQGAYAEAATAMLEAQGLEALQQWMRELRGPGGARGHLQLLDDSGKPVFGRTVADDVAAAVAERSREVAAPTAPAGVYVEPIYAPDGERYWFISDMRHHRRGVPRGPWLRMGKPAPEAGGIRLIIALIVSGLVCYGLARYLTNPIRRLQKLSHEIANGNFNVRVGDNARKDEFGDLGRDFDRMAMQLERLKESQQQLMRDVSHELRSPLARLHVALGLARQRADESVSAELDRIEAEAEALDSLIGSLLSFSRLESGSRDLIMTSVSMTEMIESIVRDAEFEIVNSGKSISAQSAGDIVVICDEGLIKSAVENVVRNAVRHTDDNTDVRVELTEDAPNSAVKISVSDHGPGVPEHLLQELFKPFVRVEYARDRDSGGHGIGLAIAEAAVRSHGGEIHARNISSGGLVVEITLPLSPQSRLPS